MPKPKNNDHELIVVLGPTATGKTRLAVQIAVELDGEIISADSRQVYRGLDIGTGKDLEEYSDGNKTIPYHLIDIIDPDEDYSVYRFQQEFHATFKEFQHRNKQPIICGGTGFYIESILLNYQMPEIKSNPELRNSLENEPMENLRNKLFDLKGNIHNKTDFEHRKRIIRAIEIAMQPPGNIPSSVGIKNYIVFGIQYPRGTVRERISERLTYRLENGLIEEVEHLVQQGMTFDRLDYFGLEYRFIAKYLKDEMTYSGMVGKLTTAINQFSKRQMTFFRRMERRGVKIHWIPEGNYQQVMKLILKSK